MGFLSDIPIIGGVVDTLTGKPVAQQQHQISLGQKAAFATSPEEQRYIDYIAQQAYAPQTGPSSQAQEIANIYASKTRGEGPSVAQAQLAQSQAQARAAAAGTMGSARGVQNPALLARQAAQQGALMEQQGAGQAAILRAQEQEAGLRGFERTTGTQEQLALQKQQQKMQQAQALGGALGQQAASRQQLALAEMGSTERNIREQNQAAQEASKGQMSAIGGIAGAALPFLSDVNLKKDIKEGTPAMDKFLSSLAGQPPETRASIQNFLDSMRPYEYKYKQGEVPDGNAQHLGVMAQDLEKSPVGDRMVIENGEGDKMIQPDMGTILATAAYNNQRIKDLEDEVRGVRRAPGSVGDTYYEGSEKRLQVPEFDRPDWAIDERGRVVEIAKLPVKPVRRADRVIPMQAAKASPSDIARVSDYLDMMGNMKRAQVPSSTFTKARR